VAIASEQKGGAGTTRAWSDETRKALQRHAIEQRRAGDEVVREAGRRRRASAQHCTRGEKRSGAGLADEVQTGGTEARGGAVDGGGRGAALLVPGGDGNGRQHGVEERRRAATEEEEPGRWRRAAGGRPLAGEEQRRAAALRERSGVELGKKREQRPTTREMEASGEQTRASSSRAGEEHRDRE
jgi:hypothetical protein